MFSKNTKVVVLSDSSFDNKKIKNGSRGIVMFGNVWCGYCKKAAPGFEKAASLLGQRYKFYYVNCDDCPMTAKRFGIKGYPTIKYVDTNGIPYKDYTGARDVKSFLDSICIEASVCQR